MNRHTIIDPPADALKVLAFGDLSRGVNFAAARHSPNLATGVADRGRLRAQWLPPTAEVSWPSSSEATESSQAMAASPSSARGPRA